MTQPARGASRWDRLDLALRDSGYSADEATELVGLTRAAAGRYARGGPDAVTPGVEVLAAMLRIQGFGEAESALLARVLPRIDWGRLFVVPRQAADVFGISLVSLFRMREDGRWPAAVNQPKGPRTDLILYWLADVLHLAVATGPVPSGGPVPWIDPGLTLLGDGRGGAGG